MGEGECANFLGFFVNVDCVIPSLTILSTVVVTVLPYLENYICNLDSLFIGSEINLSVDKTHVGMVNREICENVQEKQV